MSEFQLHAASRLLFGQIIDPATIDADEIKSVFRQKALRLHPDVRHGDSEQFRAIVEARNILISHAEISAKKKARTSFSNNTTTSLRSSTSSVNAALQKNHSINKLPKKPHERYYSGPMPTYRLRFGQFLYCKGEISWQDFVSAIRWQRDQRPKFGELAAMWGWLAERDIRIIRAATEIPGLFGEKAVQTGFLTERQAKFISTQQHMIQPRLGEYFTRERLLLTNDIRRLLREQHQHNQNILHGPASEKSVSIPTE